MTSAAPPRRRTPRALRIAGIALGAYLTRIIVEPVRKGRLRETDWPAGLRPIATVGLVGYVVAALLNVFAGPLREVLPLASPTSRGAVAVPAALVWLIFALTALSLTLAYSGALHARVWLRWLVTGFVALVVLFVASVGTTLDHPRIVAAAAAGALVVLTAVRGHRRFAWWEFALTACLVWGSLVTSAAGYAATSRSLGFEFMPILVSLMLLTLGQLAVPSALAAGASVAKFAVSSAIWAARTVRDRIGGRAVFVVLALVVAWRVVDLVLSGAGLIEGAPGSLRSVAGAVLLFALIIAAWLGIRLLRRGGGIPSAPVILDRIDVVAIAIAAVTSVPILSAIAYVLSQVLVGFGLAGAGDVVLSITVVTGSSTTIAVARALGGTGLLVLAAVQARRGRGTLPELLAAVGIAMILLALTWLTDFSLVWDGDTLAVVGTLAALIVLAVTLARRRLTAEVAVSVLVALLISMLFAYGRYSSTRSRSHSGSRRSPSCCSDSCGRSSPDTETPIATRPAIRVRRACSW